MDDRISRRHFAGVGTGLVIGSAVAGPALGGIVMAADDAKPKGPVEASFERDYEAPGFVPSWRKPQINRTLVQDFVIYAHSDPGMVEKLLAKEPALLNAAMDWGAGDWETALGGASHMGRRDVVAILLKHGARPDLFCAAMMGQLEVVRGLLTLEPALIDAKGPHGFTLHFHAQVGGKEAEPVLDYLQSVKRIELGPNPFLRGAAGSPPK